MGTVRSPCRQCCYFCCRQRRPSSGRSIVPRYRTCCCAPPSTARRRFVVRLATSASSARQQVRSYSAQRKLPQARSLLDIRRSVACLCRAWPASPSDLRRLLRDLHATLPSSSSLRLHGTCPVGSCWVSCCDV